MQQRGLTPIGVDIYTPDFQMLARGFGCDSCRADDAESLRRVLGEAAGSSRSRPLLIESSEAQWLEAWP
jgi:acetolactate synthase-1/2/3 large subunit